MATSSLLRSAPSSSISTQLRTPLHSSFQGAASLWWPHHSRTSRPKIFLLFIPGNPGLCSYYIPYLQTIYDSPELRGRVEILAIDHRGHSPLPRSSNSFPGTGAEDYPTQPRKGSALQDTIQHKIAAVKAIRRVYPKSPLRQPGQPATGGNDEEEEVKLILIGHSVGSYIGLKVLQDRGGEVDGLQILFPTVTNIAKSPKARSLPLLLATNSLVQNFLFPLPLLFLSLLPAVLLFPVLSFLSLMPAAGLRTTLDFLLTPSAPLNACKLAAEEFATIKDLDKPMYNAVKGLQSRGGSIRSYWSKGNQDSWAPETHRKELERALGLKQITLPDHISLVMGDQKEKETLSSRRGLRSRTLRMGGSITRAAGRTIQSAASGASGAVGAAAEVATGRRNTTTRRPPQSSSRKHAASYFAPHGQPESPTQQRRGTGQGATTVTSPSIYTSSPMMSPSAGGLSHSLDDKQQALGSPMNELTRSSSILAHRRRRSSVALASAKRAMDGSITLELPEGQYFGHSDVEEEGPSDLDQRIVKNGGAKQALDEEDVFSDKNGKSYAAAAAQPPSASGRSHPPLLSDLPPPISPESHLGGAEASSIGTTRKGNDGSDRLSSTVCNLGMPHAFCLRHGEAMGKISSYWLMQDYL